MTAATSEKGHFSAEKVFVALFILTAMEVGWSFLPFLSTFMLRLGLVIFALWKGYLIFTYFMHMKFEGWVVKGLIAPTLPLVAIVVFATMPDVSMNHKLKYPVGYMRLDDGKVVDQEHAAEARGIGQKHTAHDSAEAAGAPH
jgi:caa(3)-type oxidase subunit IV